MIGWVNASGKQHIESTRIKGRSGTGYSHAEAKRMLSEREAAIGKGGTVNAKQGRRLFTECLEDVIRDQQVNERRDLRHTKGRIEQHLTPFFREYRVAEITTALIRRYTADRKDAGAKPATLNRELAIIRRALRLAARNGDVLTVPHVELLDESRNVRAGVIEPADFARVLKHLRPKVYAAVAEVAMITGWRLRSELLTLTWSQIDLRAGLLRMDVGQSKAGEGRSFPITKRLRQILEPLTPETPSRDALVFTEEDGSAITDSHFYDRWHPACEAAGFPDLIPHDLRRSAVREMERRRIPRQVAMRLVGHRTESIYRRYALVLESDIHDAGSRLDDHTPPTTHRKKARRKA